MKGDWPLSTPNCTMVPLCLEYAMPSMKRDLLVCYCPHLKYISTVCSRSYSTGCGWVNELVDRVELDPFAVILVGEGSVATLRRRRAVEKGL